MPPLITALLLILAANAELPAYRCPLATEATQAAPAVIVDGRLEEAAWQAAAWTADFVPLVGPGGQTFALQRTRAKFLFDAEHIYIAAEMSETDVRGEMTRHDDHLYRENAFEMFIDPNDDGENYLELEVNALGTTFDLIMSKPYQEKGTADEAFDIEGLRVGVHVDGTLNDAADQDRAWTVEMAIPWKSIASLAGEGKMPPKMGDKWRVNMARVMVPREKGQRTRYATWSPINERSLHVPGRWGWVEFVRGSTDTRGPATKASAAKSK